MTYLRKRDYIKFLIESCLIIFSVLLALFLNEYRYQKNEEVIRKDALMKVKNELALNLEVLNEWLPYHKSVLSRFNKAMTSDSIKSSLLKAKTINYWRLMPQGVVQKLIDNTAWDVLKFSSAISNIDFNTMLTLSKVYKLQKEGVESTVKLILKVITSRESLDKKNIDTTIVLLRNSFRELVSQEVYLIEYYKKVLSELKLN